MVALLLASALGACTLATSTGSPTERPRGSPTERLLRDGYAVLDGALTAEEVREVRKSCASLQARGAMRHLGQEGRDDSVCVLDPARLDHPSYGALSLAAALSPHAKPKPKPKPKPKSEPQPKPYAKPEPNQVRSASRRSGCSRYHTCWSRVGVRRATTR